MKKSFAVLILFFSFLVSAHSQVSSLNDTLVKQKPVSDSVCLTPEISATFAGGEGMFKAYLKKYFQYSADDTKGIVVVKFLVSKDGKASDIEIMDGPQELRKDVIKMIKKGVWVPAMNIGRQVSSYKRISISFPLDN